MGPDGRTPGGLVGRRLGKYQVLAELARGGQGVVVRARHTEIGREVALKVLTDRSPSSVARFRQEAKLLGRLDHPHMVAVHDLGDVEGLPFMAQELVRGDSLKRVVQREGLPSAARIVEVLTPIAEALDYCHAHGVLHRDLKPDNIMIREDGRPVLVDFGLAKPLGSELMKSFEIEAISLTGETKGTPSYMAPEQADEEFGQVGPLTDVYALGATLYFLLTGAPPFTGTTTYNVIVKLMRDDPPDARVTTPAVDPCLAELSRRSMSKTPIARPESAAAFARELLAARDAPVGGGRARLLLPAAALVLVLVGVIGIGRDGPSPPAAVTASEKTAAQPRSPEQTAPSERPSSLRPGPKSKPLRADLARARDLFRKGKFRHARDKYRRILEAMPDDLSARLGLVRSLLKLWAQPAAKPHFERLPRTAERLVLESTYHLGFRNGSTQAERLCEEAIRLDPTYAEAYAHLARALYKQARYAEALAAARTAVKLDVRSAAGWHYLGLVLRKEGGSGDEVLEAFNKALGYDPTYYNAYQSRGNLRYDQGEYVEAMRDFERALEFQPRYSYAARRLAQCHFALAQVAASRAERLKHLELADRYFGEAHRLFRRSKKEQRTTMQLWEVVKRQLGLLKR